jgi:hypothetical protein
MQPDDTTPSLTSQIKTGILEIAEVFLSVLEFLNHSYSLHCSSSSNSIRNNYKNPQQWRNSFEAFGI